MDRLWKGTTLDISRCRVAGVNIAPEKKVTSFRQSVAQVKTPCRGQTKQKKKTSSLIYTLIIIIPGNVPVTVCFFFLNIIYYNYN